MNSSLDLLETDILSSIENASFFPHPNPLPLGEGAFILTLSLWERTG
jgi:hypothetical protein